MPLAIRFMNTGYFRLLKVKFRPIFSPLHLTKLRYPWYCCANLCAF